MLNLVLFVANPYASPWHYHSQDPVLFRISETADENLSLGGLVRILDATDLAYGARKPTPFEMAKMSCLRATSILFLPATLALGMRDFIGYIGPANERQQAFTASVKERYNHIARLAIEKGYLANGFLYQVEPSLSKRNGISFAEVRRSRSGQAGDD